MAGANAFSPLSASCHKRRSVPEAAPTRVLLVEDDPILGSAVRDQVAADGHGVDWAKRLAEAGDFVRLAHYDLILLDLMLPDGRGLDFLRSRRQAGDTTAVMILTARDQVSDRIAGLNAGADDYLVKPFDLAELSARLSAVARRYGGNPNPLMQIGGLTLDLAARSIVKDGRSISLTAREWALFDAFIQRPAMLLSKALLEERLYTFDSEVESNTIEVYVGRLRKKLGAEVIETVRGMGYRLGTATLAGSGKSRP